MSKLGSATVAGADVVVLVGLRPDLATLRDGLAAPRRWLVEDGPDRVLAALTGCGLWIVGVWIGVALLAAALARVPGTAGRVAGSFARVALPAVLRRLVIGSAGLTVVLAPMAPLTPMAAASAHPAPGTAAGAVGASALATSAAPLPGPSWPGSTATPDPLPGPAWPRSTPGTASAPAPVPSVPRDPPASRPAASHPAPTHPAPSHPSSGPSGAPRRAQPPAPTTQTRSGAAGERVTVRAGDCLWLLAAHRLGPAASEHDVADYVPRLYRTNRSVIGDDPDVITPGQVLDLPATD